MASTERLILPDGAAAAYDRLFSASALSVHRDVTGESDQFARAGRQMLRNAAAKKTDFDPHDEKLGDRRAGGPPLAELDPNKPL